MRSRTQDVVEFLPGIESSRPTSFVHTWHREAVRRIRAVYVEMPDLRVTAEDGARLWHLDPRMCREALRQLVEDGFLCIRGHLYVRA